MEAPKSTSDAARGILNEVLTGSAPGTQATAQAANQPAHYHQHQTSGETHMNAFAGTSNPDGSVTITDLHSDDK